jgi:hypothetical protein
MRWFDDLQLAQLLKLERINPTAAEWLREVDAVYLYGSIGVEAVLKRDGTVRLRLEEWPDLRPHTERVATPAERLEAIALGAMEFPQLKELLPVRPTDAPDCPACGGSGEYSLAKGVLCPQCAGAGWVAATI